MNNAGCFSLLLLSISLALSSCSTENVGGKELPAINNAAIFAIDTADDEFDLGKFGKSYKKTRHLLNILKNDGQSITGTEINHIKIELAESLRASGNYDEGIVFLHEVINDKSNNLNHEILGRAFDRMAAIYYELYIHNQDLNFLLDSTFHYSFQALEIARHLNNTLLESSTLNIIGASYIQIKDYFEAEKILMEAGKIISQNHLEPDLAQIANLSYVKYQLGDYSEALTLAETCFQLALDHDLFPFYMIGLELMGNTYEAMGMNTKCDELREKHRELSSLKDPILESLLAKQLIASYKHNIDKEKISLLSNERYYLVRLSGILTIVLILLIGFSVLLVFLFRQKQKSVRLHHELLLAKQEADKLTIENAELLLKRKVAESKILEAELASKQSVLASKLLTITKQNEFLIHLLHRIKQINIHTSNTATRKGLIEIIELVKNKVQSKNWEELETMYASGNSNFIINLNKAHPDLTSNERRLCLLLQMNLSTKEISDITMQSCRALEMARHRLRSKFRLERNANLNVYLANFD